MSAKTVAIMQPYFFPYLGYMGLMAHADEFVVLDCVQFPRRGRVHRCHVPGPNGAERWLTLPLARAHRSTAICDMEFSAQAQRLWAVRRALHPWISAAKSTEWTDALAFRGASVSDYLVEQLIRLRDAFGLCCAISRSSDLTLDPTLRGAARLVAIAKARGAKRYINAPGGKSLYAPADFHRHGVSLHFLPDYDGPYRHMLPALMRGEIPDMIADLTRYAGKPLETAEGADA